MDLQLKVSSPVHTVCLTAGRRNRYRVAQLGGAKLLTPIYEECGHTLLRRNAQVVLSNIAMLAENGQVLLEGKLPEEFLVMVPMRLNKVRLARGKDCYDQVVVKAWMIQLNCAPLRLNLHVTSQKQKQDEQAQLFIEYPEAPFHAKPEEKKTSAAMKKFGGAAKGIKGA